MACMYTKTRPRIRTTPTTMTARAIAIHAPVVSDSVLSSPTVDVVAGQFLELEKYAVAGSVGLITGFWDCVPMSTPES